MHRRASNRRPGAVVMEFIFFPEQNEIYIWAT